VCTEFTSALTFAEHISDNEGGLVGWDEYA